MLCSIRLLKGLRIDGQCGSNYRVNNKVTTRHLT